MDRILYAAWTSLSNSLNVFCRKSSQQEQHARDQSKIRVEKSDTDIVNIILSTKGSATE